MRDRLLKIQSELKAPKGQTNKFGGYQYRSCEDILEAVKPLCIKNEVTLIISDDIVEVGGRIYVKATARLTSIEPIMDGKLEGVEACAFAREPESQKGMSESQLTGTASSYARKYALNGLFAIDDTKDADTNEHGKQTKTLSKEDLATRFQTCKNKFELENAYKKYKVDVDALPAPQAKAIKALVNECKLAHERGV